MIAALRHEDEIDPRSAGDGLSYAAARSPRRNRRVVLPAAAVGLGLALGGAALVVAQSL